MSVSIPLEDNFEATLTQKLDASASALTIYVSKVPTATIPAGKEVVLTIAPKKGFTRQENVLVESYSAVNKTLTIKTAGRAQSRYNGDSPVPFEHPVGTKIIISDAFPVWNSLDDFIPVTGGTFTGPLDFGGASATFRLPNLTTVARDALVAPQNGMKIYNTTLGEEQSYNGGTWVTVASGGTFPNASETVAGKAEQSTLAQQITKTETGETGAPLFLNPKNTAINSTDAAQGRLVQLNASSLVDSTLLPGAAGFTTSGTANTTIANMDALAFNGNRRIDKADGDVLNQSFLFAGIATAAGTAGNAQTYVPTGPIVDVPAFTVAQRFGCRLWDGETNATSNTTTDVQDAAAKWRSQTYTPAANQDNFGAVSLNLTKTGSPTGSATIRLRAVVAGLPSGADLGTATLAYSAIATGDNTFVLATPIATTPSTLYAIILDPGAGVSGGNSIAWNYQNTNVYANGQSVNSADSGSSWTAEATFDRRFTVQYRGIAGEPVFLSNTAGALALTPGTYGQRIGYAVSTSTISLSEGLKSVYATYSYTANATATVDTELTMGFRPMFIFSFISAGGATGSMGMWMNGGVSFSLENKGLSADSSGTTTLKGSFSTSLLYTGNQQIITDANYINQFLTVQATSANTVTVRRALTLTGTTSQSTIVYLHILGY